MTPNVNHVPDVTLRASRAYSRLLFGGARYRVEIGVAIRARPVVNTAELADELGLSRQSVNQELRLLERCGLLCRVDGDSARKVYLIPQPSLYWDFCEEAAEAAERRLRDAQEL
jgi:biotin operon repressor